MRLNPDAAKIRRWRDERHWSQEHLADLAGIGVRTIQRIENGEAASRESLMALAAAFNVDVYVLTADTKGLAALRLSFWISLASYVFGMILFAGISIGAGGGTYLMLWPSIWWTVGVAGHALTLVIVELVTRYQQTESV